MAKLLGTITVDNERCKGCALCLVACPQKIIALAPAVNHKGYNYAEPRDPELRCTSCAACATVCPDGCITVYRLRNNAQ